VGTDPFIVGSRAFKVNRFREILLGLQERYPDKLHFYQYNTGGMGEILEKYEEDGRIVKNVIREVERVPINLMASIQRGDLRRTNKYQPGIFGTERIVNCEGGDLSRYDPYKYYSQEQIDKYLSDLVDGRRKFTEEIIEEGLNKEIIDAAEKSFAIAPEKKAVPAGIPAVKPEAKEEKLRVDASVPRSMFSDTPPVRRPSRSFRDG
jgi:phosphoenolpyruvate carboxykinase (ATP)